MPGHLTKTVTVSGKIAAVISAAPLDVVIEHLDVPAFDLIIATNILPYFDDVELMLAMSNVTKMLVPGGVFLHNEPRAALGPITDALGLPVRAIAPGCHRHSARHGHQRGRAASLARGQRVAAPESEVV